MKVVKITWIDSCSSDSSWTLAEDANTGIIQIETYGIVIKETDEFISVAQNYGSEPEQFCNIMTIPKGCIKETITMPNMVKERNNNDKDEGIRKELISLINDLWAEKQGLMINRSDYEKYIAWLEKQKELTSDEEKPGKEDVLWCIDQARKHAKDENEMGTCWFAEKWLEKQGEQKYTQRDIDDAYLKGITDTKHVVEKESEEDKKIRADIAEFIFKSQEDIKDRSKWIDYLGYIPTFVGEKNKIQKEAEYTWNPDEKKLEKIEQKTAWSDEQIKAIESLKHKWSMGNSAEAKYKVEAYDELIEMLKEEKS